MSKITFRADADLVDRLEGFEASKSEVMREALRSYLDGTERPANVGDERDAADVEGGDDAAGSRDRDSESRDSESTGSEPSGSQGSDASLDDVLAARVDELVGARLDEALGPRRAPGIASGARPFGAPGGTPAVSLTVNVDSAGDVEVDPETASDTETTADSPDGDRPGTDVSPDSETTACAQCGEDVSDDHVYCPNCGEKATHRLFCECGDELRSDWGFCPGCGRRTPAADVLDNR